MQVIADLEVHSKYARAVSSQMILPTISAWGKKKGITLLGTGDFTHPLWLKEIQTQLIDKGEGIYGLKDDKKGPSFIFTSEISSIFSQKGRSYRIHTMVYAPSVQVAEKIKTQLLNRGCNLMSDGRPIVGLSCKELAEIVLSVSEKSLIIPAHVWTPWFGFYGANGGFDSLVEGFGEYAKFVHAIETGLSSDPAMNWGIAELSGRNIVSFSDAHSPSKLGREVTVFELKEEFGYEDVYAAITGKSNSSKISYTIEFYPEEGKYHYTGHRNCQVKHSPDDTQKMGTTCPVCGRKLTVGVMHRVEELARYKVDSKEEIDKNGVKWYHHPKGERPSYVMLVPLIEILSEALESGVSSQKVVFEYEKLTNNLGSEFEILMQTNPEDIKRVSGVRVAEGIMKVRSGDIIVDPGYDGVFGKVRIWGEQEGETATSQISLFE